METDAESFCCAEADEFYEELFEVKLTLCVFLMSNSMPYSLKIYIAINSVFV